MKRGRMALWETIESIDNLPQTPCCYVIYLNGVMSYIGSTENLKARIAKHIFNHPEWRGSAMVLKVKTPRRFGQWAMDELRLIRKLKPPLNRNGKETREFIPM